MTKDFGEAGDIAGKALETTVLSFELLVRSADVLAYADGESVL